VATSSQPPFDELLEVLREIARGLKDPKTRALATEVPAEVATNHLDYLAIQELMGRRGGPKDPLNSVVFAATRTRKEETDFSTITVNLPPGPFKLAVFTVRGAPTETVGRPQDGEPVTSDGGSSDVNFTLTKVTNDQPIIRLELQRADGYPIKLGPRLGTV
jgi:hypothetical protein